VKIVEANVHELSIPIETGGPHGWGKKDWKSLPFVLLEIVTDAGLVGWGEGFCYGRAHSTVHMLREVVAPQIVGSNATEISGVLNDLLSSNVRTGPTLHAISAVDIALWDIAGKAAGLPLHRLLGGARHLELPAFASFFRFEDAGLVREMCQRALEEKMCWLKLHEDQEECVAAARDVAPFCPLIVDVNCAWRPAAARSALRRLQQYDLLWLEEPIDPPDDLDSLALLRQLDVPFALGENAATLSDFQRIIDSGAVDYVLPGVTKIGGVSVVRKVLAVAEARNIAAIPWTPIHGPGLLASLHLMSTLPVATPVEFFYYTSIDAHLFGTPVGPSNGLLTVPQGAGLGYDPDPEVLSRFAA
jgi:L-alanine-DL-glutamate epimerase-like enolase superfamily enzyme